LGLGKIGQVFFFFQKKKQKALLRFAEGQVLEEPTQEVCDLPLKK
jgi:hypothetical protein